MSSNYVKQAQDLIDNNDFLVISKSWCPDCHFANRVFTEHNVRQKAKWIELDHLPGNEGPELQKAFLKLTNQNTVPNIFFKGKHIGGEVQLEKLRATEKLDDELKAAKLL